MFFIIISKTHRLQNKKIYREIETDCNLLKNEKKKNSAEMN